MAKYTLPAPKKLKEKYPSMCGSDDEWRRRITLPVDDKILDAVEVGETIAITLKAKVRGMSENTDSKQSRCDLSIELTSVEV